MVRTTLLLCGWLAVLSVPSSTARPIPGVPADSIGMILAQVSPDSIEASIRTLQGFGTRLWSSSNRDSIASWILGRFAASGVTDVLIDEFLYTGTWQLNVIATIPGTSVPSQEIVFGAHTDSYTGTPTVAPGADDNASGVAAVLEIARVIIASGYRPACTLRFVGFGAEEVGLYGSRDYAAKARNADRPIIAMFNFDMIGYRNPATVDPEFEIIWYDNARFLATLDSAMALMYTPLVPVKDQTSYNRSDSFPFYLNNYPPVFLHDGGASRAYHTVFDIIDSLDMSYAADITRVGLASALTLDLQVRDGPAPGDPLPAVFALEQNYPNPFNPGTRIPYRVSQASNVTVRVYDMLGREVATLADGWHAQGSYSVAWNAGAHAAGVYFCRMQWAGGSATRRMVLLR